MKRAHAACQLVNLSSVSLVFWRLWGCVSVFGVFSVVIIIVAFVAGVVGLGTEEAFSGEFKAAMLCFVCVRLDQLKLNNSHPLFRAAGGC